MCLMCQEEDLYFLYLEQRERAERRARGETSPPNANWLWPAFATAAPSSPGSRETTAAMPKPAFVCDAPE